jgi:putative colanic acid biosynthesis acetyltransferase WcaF
MSAPDSRLASAAHADPYLRAQTGLASRVARAAWGLVWLLLFRTTPRPLHAWRAFLLRLFGARIGPSCHIYPGARIWAPWNLECEEAAAIADEAHIYNPSPVRLGSHSIVSQQAYLCGADHDYDDPDFPMISAPIEIGAYAWICTRATVRMGVRVGDGAIIGLGAVLTRDAQPWGVYGGVPARKIGARKSRPLL